MGHFREFIISNKEQLQIKIRVSNNVNDYLDSFLNVGTKIFGIKDPSSLVITHLTDLKII